MNDLSHFDETGKIKMVDVSGKEITTRRAVASGKVILNSETLKTMQTKQPKAATPLEIARIAGIMAAKKTSELIPLCHQINLSKVNVTAEFRDFGIYLEAEAITNAQTGVGDGGINSGFQRNFVFTTCVKPFKKISSFLTFVSSQKRAESRTLS